MPKRKQMGVTGVADDGYSDYRDDWRAGAAVGVVLGGIFLGGVILGGVLMWVVLR